MAITKPVTPGQMSFFIGITPIWVVWLYAEWLEYRRRTGASKMRSDINLVQLDSEAVSQDERAVLLEGGTQPAAHKSHSSSVTDSLTRFLLMDGSFFIENRVTLRAMSEFGLWLAYFYICDRTDIFGQSKKVVPDFTDGHDTGIIHGSWMPF